MPAAAPSRLDALLDEALAPYRGIWPAHVVAAFREEMLATLQTHPAARRLAAEAGVDVDGASGEVHLGGAQVEDEAPGRPRTAGAK